MKHYLNVCDVNGAKVEPVDVITFGSPCQDLSVAGKRAGLKHESNGDEETTRSGLFMEAIRIIKEMREEDGIRQLRSGRADGHIRPRFAVWENVPGAFSSNKGEDFRVVLEELARIKDTEISIPMSEKGKWKTAGEIVGDGWSIAWRTLDAQYHGIPQRRRRIFLVADFADECAGEILFECKGLPGYPSENREEGQGIAGDFAKGIRGTGEGNGIGFDGYNQAVTGDVSKAITTFIAQEGKYDMSNRIFVGDVSPTLTTQSADYKYLVPLSIENHPNDSRVQIREDGTVQSLTGRMGTGGGNVPLVAEPKGYAMQTIGEYKDCDCASTLKSRDYKDATDLVCEPVALHDPSCAIDASYYKGPGERNDIERNIVAQPVFALDRASFNQGENAQYDFQISDDGIAHTLVARGLGAVCYHEFIKYIVRRLTPTECARLQGMPDEWCRLSQIDDMSDEDYEFWKQAHFEKWKLDKLDTSMDEDEIEFIISKYKHKTKSQMIKWYNKLQSDSPEYKAYGNGMALPCVRIPIHGIAQHGAKTMASLFDGIGGFPLAGLIDGIETLWTSEIELFPIAVTKERFEEYEKYGCFTFGINIISDDRVIECV